MEKVLPTIPYFYAGGNKELDLPVDAGLMEYSDDGSCQGCPAKEIRTCWFNRLGPDWPGDELGMYIYDVER